MPELVANLRKLTSQYWWITPLVIFVFWRLGVELVGQIALVTAGPIPHPWPAEPFPPLWARWDSGWYSSVLAYGYNLRPGQISNVTFFPAFPLLWQAVQWVSGLPRMAAGVLTANLVAIPAVLVFYRWAQTITSTRVATRSLVALLAFPTSFFLISAYSESTLLLFLVLCLLAAENKKWAWAAGAAALASAARPVGIILWPILLYWWWKSAEPRRASDATALTILPPLGLVAFSLYLFYTTGHPLAWLYGHADSGRHLASPLNTLWFYVQSIWYQEGFYARYLAELAALVFACLALVRAWRGRTVYGLLIVLTLLPAILSATLTSLQRIVLVLPPLFLAVGSLERRSIYLAYLCVSVPLLVLAITLFVRWKWAG